MSDQYLFSSVYARLLLRAEIPVLDPPTAAFGADPSSVKVARHITAQQKLHGTGLSEVDLDQQAYLPWSTVKKVLANIEAAGAPADWPTTFARQLSLASHGPLGFAALSAPTLESALLVLVDYHAIRSATLDVALLKHENQPHAQLRIIELTGDRHFGRQIVETTVQIVLDVIEAIIGHRLGDPVTADFAYPAHKNSGTKNTISESLGIHCRFDCDTTAINFPASWLDIGSPLYEESVYRANINKCREQIEQLYLLAEDPVAIIHNRLAQYFERPEADLALDSPPDLESCAALLNMSPRTLIRRLEQRDQSYKKLLRGARQHYAFELLGNTHLAVNDIAWRLGYRDTSNFVRAFRQWCNETPAGWRKSNSAKRNR